MKVFYNQKLKEKMTEYYKRESLSEEVTGYFWMFYFSFCVVVNLVFILRLF